MRDFILGLGVGLLFMSIVKRNHDKQATENLPDDIIDDSTDNSIDNSSNQRRVRQTVIVSRTVYDYERDNLIEVNVCPNNVLQLLAGIGKLGNKFFPYEKKKSYSKTGL